MTTRTYFV